MKLIYFVFFFPYLTTFVQIFGSCQIVNIALYKNTNQSNTNLTSVSSFAVDGNTYTLSESVPDAEGHSWWQVDLGFAYVVTTIQIIQHFSKNEYVMSHIFATLKNDATTVYAPDDFWGANFDLIETITMTKAIDSKSASSGRYVTIWKYDSVPTGFNNLAMAEVRIFGYIEDESSNSCSVQPSSTSNPLMQVIIGLSVGLACSIIIIIVLICVIVCKNYDVKMPQIETQKQQKVRNKKQNDDIPEYDNNDEPNDLYEMPMEDMKQEKNNGRRAATKNDYERDLS